MTSVGQQLANEGTDRVLANSNEEAKQILWEELMTLMRLQPLFFTSDDLQSREIVSQIMKQYCIHPNSIPALFRKASSKGLIEKTGQVIASLRPSAHGRLIQVWRKCDEAN